MKVALLNGPIPYQNAITHMPLDLIYIGSSLKREEIEVKGYDIALEGDEDCGLNRILSFSPDIIITCFSRVLFDGTRCLPSALSLLKNIKEKNPGIHICAIGEQATFRPERTIEYSFIDSLIRFTPERVAFSLCMGLKRGENIENIKGVLTKTNIQEQLQNKLWYDHLDSLDQLGQLDRTIFPVEKYLQKDTETTAECTRGCAHRCLFCQRSRYHKYTVTKSIPLIVEDMRNCKRLGFKSIFFTDLDFVRDVSFAKKVCKGIVEAENPIEWACNIRADIIDEEDGIELLKLMKKAGCYRVFVGLESASDKILSDVHKGITQDYGFKLKKTLDDIGIKMHASFLIGLPNDDPEKINETVNYAKLLNADMTSINSLIPLPGTPYGDNPKKYGLFIQNDDMLWFEKESFVNKQVCGNKQLTADELDKLHKKVYKDFLS